MERIPWNKGLKTGLIPKTAFKNGHIPFYKGKKIPIEVKKKISKTLKGLVRSGEVIIPSRKGEIPWNKGDWKKETRYSMKYLNWREMVFKRDNYKCVCCSSTKSLEADHIKPWALFPKLRFKVSNGKTLCRKCHKKTFKNYANYLHQSGKTK